MIFSKTPEDEIYKAAREHLAWHTISITTGDGGWGTGVPIEIFGEKIILTAGHNLNGYQTGTPVKFVARTDAELIEAPSDVAAKSSPFEKIRIEQTLPVLWVQVFDEQSEDLGVILLDKSQ